MLSDVVSLNVLSRGGGSEGGGGAGVGIIG